MSLEIAKQNKIQELSERSLASNEYLQPNKKLYRLMNVNLGTFYSEEKQSLYIREIEERFTELRDEFYRLSLLVESANTIEEVEGITWVIE